MNSILKVKGTNKVSEIAPEHRRVIFLTENEIDPRFRYELLLGGPNPFLSILPLAGLAKVAWDIYKENKAPLIALSEAAKNLKFPPGHPCKDSLYIQHPFRNETYFPVADYLRMFYEEKAAEFMSIMGGLKPYKVEFYYIKGVKTFGNVTAKTEAATTSASAERQSSMGLAATFEYKPKGEIDPDLKKREWLEFEPSWRSLVEQRLEHGLETMDATFAHSGFNSLSGEVKSVIEAVTVDIKAEASFATDTEWRLHLSFVAGGSIQNNRENIFKRIKDYISPGKKVA